ERGGERGGDLRREDRHPVLVAEERHRGLPARQLREPGAKEHTREGEPEEQLAHGERHALEPPHDHGPASTPTTSASPSSLARAPVRSKSASIASAASAA